MIRKKAKELGKAPGIENAQFLRRWVVHFKSQHNLVERAHTQISQKFPKDMPLVVRNFLKKVHEKTVNIEKNI